MLYIDQPTQVGFSYDTPTNGTKQLVVVENDAGFMTFPANFTEVPESNLTYRVGTFSSQDNSKTANTTAFAAHALWHFAQTWFFEFPNYKPHDDRISLWAESYGGHYGPGIFRFFQEQNEKIANGNSVEKDAHFLHLDTLGIVNGLIDLAIAGEAWITYGYNNVSDLDTGETGVSLVTELDVQMLLTVASA
jgi:carboxypeptidase C (cathepsin A)